MGFVLAVLPSINLINRIRNRLNRDGQYFGMIRAPQCISPGGCGFALRFEESKLILVKQAAQELGVAVNGFYKEEDQKGSIVYTHIE